MLEKINEEALENVTGGARNQLYDFKKKEFDNAWAATQMEKKYSGRGRRELLDEWLKKGEMSAAEFLLSL